MTTPICKAEPLPVTLAQCIICGCLWRDNQDGTVSLAYPSQECGIACCDNVEDVGQYRAVVLTGTLEQDKPSPMEERTKQLWAERAVLDQARKDGKLPSEPQGHKVLGDPKPDDDPASTGMAAHVRSALSTLKSSVEHFRARHGRDAVRAMKPWGKWLDAIDSGLDDLHESDMYPYLTLASTETLAAELRARARPTEPGCYYASWDGGEVRGREVVADPSGRLRVQGTDMIPVSAPEWEWQPDDYTPAY